LTNGTERKTIKIVSSEEAPTSVADAENETYREKKQRKKAYVQKVIALRSKSDFLNSQKRKRDLGGCN